MKIDFNEFVIRKCTKKDLSEILKLQEETLERLSDSDILRKNTVEMFEECLRHPNITLGAWYGDELAAISVLYYVSCEAEDLKMLLQNVDCAEKKSANYKLCIVRDKYRGNSLQYKMGMMLIKAAVEDGVEILCSTASPKNPYSINNILRLGFSYNRTLQKYGMERNLYYNIL